MTSSLSAFCPKAQKIVFTVAEMLLPGAELPDLCSLVGTNFGVMIYVNPGTSRFYDA